MPHPILSIHHPYPPIECHDLDLTNEINNFLADSDMLEAPGLTPKMMVPDEASIMASNFMSLLDSDPIPLADRFAKIKRNLIAGNERAVAGSFYRLLRQLRREVDRIAAAGSEIIPTIDYFDIHDEAAVSTFKKGLQQRGVAVIRRVVPQNIALSWKEETRDYLRHNPHTHGIPHNDPQMYDMYWSPGQVRARADSRLLEAQKFAMSVWHSSSEDALVSNEHPVAYADRVRMRTPGDTFLGLGPHVDSGSVERWEPDGYGRAGTYSRIFQGRWEEYDPWDSSTRIGVTSDLYNGAGSCSMFRMFQGWLSLSTIEPGCGSLLTCPMLKLTTAYLLLRPFFTPRFTPSRPPPPPAYADSRSVTGFDFLHENNWNLCVSQNSVLHGAIPGYVQELTSTLHPHLHLGLSPAWDLSSMGNNAAPSSMVSLPRVEPGDYVVWHPDLIHATDAIHAGLENDATVLYVPACPLTLTNALYLARQRRTFLLGFPAPDFAGVSSYGSAMDSISGLGFLNQGGGVVQAQAQAGERDHLDRPGVQDVSDAGGEEGLRSMGLHPWCDDAAISTVTTRSKSRASSNLNLSHPVAARVGNNKTMTERERCARRELLRRANGILFPDRFDSMLSTKTKPVTRNGVGVNKVHQEQSYI